MKAGQIEGLIELALGTYTFLIATGLVGVSKPQASAAFRKKYKWLFILLTIFLLARGGTQLAGLDW